MPQDKIALNNARGYLKDIKAKTKNLRENRDALDERFKQVTKEKNDMHTKFE